jgi:hypothetical protein
MALRTRPDWLTILSLREIDKLPYVAPHIDSLAVVRWDVRPPVHRD